MDPNEITLTNLTKSFEYTKIASEIDGCNDIEALKQSLKDCVQTLSSYQHLLTKSVEKQLLQDLKNFDPELSKIIEDKFINNNE